METKYISRRDWRRILHSDVVFCEKRLPKMHFMSSLYRIHEVTAPLHVTACGQRICAADAGYAWLHVMPEGENWCLTAMYDERDVPVQYYFSPEEMEALGDRIIRVEKDPDLFSFAEQDEDDAPGTTYARGIRMESTDRIGESGLYGDTPPVIGIAYASEKPELAAALVRDLLLPEGG